VRLVRDIEPRDRYDRLLAYVYRQPDDLFVNLAMARDGYAAQATFPPNIAHVDDFSRAVNEARDAGRGLWSACR
jgi:micrococcal nuclease